MVDAGSLKQKEKEHEQCAVYENISNKEMSLVL